MAGIYSCELLALRAWAAAGDAAEEAGEGAIQAEPAAAEPAAACPTPDHAAPADHIGSAGKGPAMPGDRDQDEQRMPLMPRSDG